MSVDFFEAVHSGLAAVVGFMSPSFIHGTPVREHWDQHAEEEDGK